MANHFGKKFEVNESPLYSDLFEFIEVMGIKQTKVIEAFGIGRSYWYKLKHQHLNGITVEHMHSFATYFGLPAEKVMALCYTTYVRGISGPSSEAVKPAPAEVSVPSGLDSDFPPID